MGLTHGATAPNSLNLEIFILRHDVCPWQALSPSLMFLGKAISVTKCGKIPHQNSTEFFEAPMASAIKK
jgi:hypothetical protein